MAHEISVDIDLNLIEVVATGERLPDSMRFDPALLSAEEDEDGTAVRVQSVSDEDEG